MTSKITEMVLTVSSSAELSILFKATIMLALGLTAVWLASRGRASLRHLFLLATFGTLLVIPLIQLTPATTIDVPVYSAADSASPPIAVATSASFSLPANAGVGRAPQGNREILQTVWQEALLFGWVAGALIMLAWLAVAYSRLRRIRRHGLPCPELRELAESLAKERDLRRPVEILLHEDVQTPLTCGVWRPTVLLPRDAVTWSDVHLRRALVHEFEHVRRGDWTVQLATRAICAVYWFHPLVWVAWRRLCLEAERACDDAVVQNSERADYADQLVLLAQRMSKAPAHPAIGMAKRGDLSTRVNAILDAHQRRGRVGLMAGVLATFAASVLVLAIAPMQAVSRPTSQEQRSNQTSRQQIASALDRDLFEAAARGNTTSVEQLLNTGANVNCAIDGDGSPLIGAARNGHLATVRLLLDRGADPNMAVPGDGSPLIMAAREGHIDVVTLLLDRGANIDQMVPEDENALIQASGEGHLAVVKLLISRGAAVNAGIWATSGSNSKREWRSALSMARKGGHDDVVAFLLSAGARDDR